ncbi:protein PAXX isoform X5 [Vidua chalybeata]|uniref:protein PAXX isoform X5 n=1 Tax=Vidua chalybeata TaxID=81927 RepID=UPI0023A89C46|nr:protein PAXX isoform X5 [Vidua chalybeata]
MAEPAGPFHVLRTRTGRFLCYCGPDGTVYGARRRTSARCSAVETLASSCSPEKNAARSQQLFLPGRHCQGHLPCSCNLLSSPSWRLLVLYPCALLDTLECPQLWLLAATHCPGALPGKAGAGLSVVALRVSGMLRSKAGHCQPQKEGRLCCASRLEAVVDPWLLLGEEAMSGPFLPSVAAGPARLGSWRLPLAMEGLAGLPELLGNL